MASSEIERLDDLRLYFIISTRPVLDVGRYLYNGSKSTVSSILYASCPVI